jgi:hypothetical protein
MVESNFVPLIFFVWYEWYPYVVWVAYVYGQYTGDRVHGGRRKIFPNNYIE